MPILVKDLSPSVIEKFTGEFKGEAIFPKDPNYDQVRKVYNAMINKHPGLIVKCRNVDDVVKAVKFAKENDLLVAVRGGGHNGGGLGLCEGGLVIDLSGIKFVHVNADEKTVHVGGGNIWAEVDAITHQFGLAVPAGIISTTGVGGLTLGGGIGYLARKHGLSCDNLISAQVVLADGQVVTASETSRPDLFWALRGGGGNFGIVTDFEFRMHPVRDIYGGLLLFEPEDAQDILRYFRDFI